jgi:hypothetical protein
MIAGQLIKKIFFTGLLLVTASLYSQEVTTYNKDSSVAITRDSKFDEVVAKQKELNIASPTMSGYRIQIYFGGIRQKASETKLDFASKYPDMSAYITYQQPNFKVRIGDFRSRFEAQKFLKEIDGMYPTSFIVPDDVKLPPLK